MKPIPAGEKKDSRAYVTELIRQYKPDVMLTHDINGEYGHGAHKLCASVAQYCVERTGDEAFMPESAEKWGHGASKSSICI